MTVENFVAPPGEAFHDFHELHTGEVVEVPSPTVEHMDAQARLEALLRGRCEAAGFTACREFYITVPSEARRVDVALVKIERLHAQRKKVFFGSSELVVEILSPSNLAMDFCFQHECVEFWIVNLEFKIVTAYRRSRTVNLYVPGDHLPLDAFGVSTRIPVADMFDPD